MSNLLGKLARRTGLYGPARSLKARLDRLRPARAAHRKRMASFYSQFVRPGALVFDVGANVGSRCEVFLELGARVVAVEPQPICQEVLARLFKGNDRLTLVCKALGEAPGEATMYLSDTSGLSTLSKEWIERVRKSGRFAGHDWSQVVTVPVTTIDALITEHGEPEFCKIDVEGFEVQVLSGLSRPIRAASFELTKETPENAVACIDRLEALGRYEYNFSTSESMTMERTAWMGADEMKSVVRTALPVMYFGDVYARRA